MDTPDEDIFNVGRFAVDAGDREWTDVSSWEPAARRAFADAAPLGTPIKAFGFRMLKTAAHTHTHVLEALRAHGDPVADAAVLAVQDASDAGVWGARPGTGSPGCPLSGPPESTLERVIALAHAGDARAGAFMVSATAQPEWLDWRRVANGQRALRCHLTGYALCLLNLSLIGGFGAPKINQVLAGTGYLTSNRDRTWVRLIETMQMFADSLREDGLRVGNRGWRSVCSVRLLHASVRVWLRGRSFDVAAFGEPINQEDMIVTQLAFCLVPLLGLERMRLADGMTKQDMLDVLHMWRYMGLLSGIREELLPSNCRDYMNSLEGSVAMLSSISMHIVEPNEQTREIVMHVLDSLAFRDPTPRSQAEHAALTRLFAGDAYSDALGLPRMDDPKLAAAVAASHSALETERWAAGKQAYLTGTARRLLAAAVMRLVFFAAWLALVLIGLLTGRTLFLSPRARPASQQRVTAMQAQAELSAARVLQPVRLFHTLSALPIIGEFLTTRALDAMDRVVVLHLGRPSSFTVKRRLPSAAAPSSPSEPPPAGANDKRRE